MLGKGRTINDLGGPPGREFMLSFFFLANRQLSFEFFFPGRVAVEFFFYHFCPGPPQIINGSSLTDGNFMVLMATMATYSMTHMALGAT